MSTFDTEQIRTQLNGVLERAKTDPTYLTQLKSNPGTTLTAAGLPNDAVGAAADELGLGDDVSGYMRSQCGYTCDGITCIITRCGAMPWTN
jgi:hypothetical protein